LDKKQQLSTFSTQIQGKKVELAYLTMIKIQIKKTALLIVIVFSLYGYLDHNPYVTQSFAKQSTADDSVLISAYKNQESNIQVNGSGIVIQNLADDTNGSRHQKFILKLSSGQTLLISHNIDLAPRINALRKGDTVNFYGVYEWNSKGGVVHWTHHDPNGKHADGWLKHKGVTYQ